MIADLSLKSKETLAGINFAVAVLTQKGTWIFI